MDRFRWAIPYLNSFFVRILAVLGALWLLYSVVKELGILDVTNTASHTQYAIGAVILVAIIVGLYTIFDWIFDRSAEFLDSAELKRLRKVLSQRIGTKFSYEVLDENFLDRRHKYKLLEREDFLSYTDGDYLSVRRISGNNVSRTVSDGLVYCESTEYKIPFDECEIVAFDVNTGNKLFVESITDTSSPQITHAFKIHFPNPIRPGGEFDIAYRIFFPKEIRILNRDREVMSISLRRIANAVEVLKFTVNLDFTPASSKAFEQSGEKLSVHQENEISSFNYNDYSSELRQLVAVTPTNLESTISIEVNRPSAQMYILEYIRDDTSKSIAYKD